MDYSTMSKSDLMKVLTRLKHDIQTYKEKEEKTKLTRALSAYKRAREAFYECAFCRHAKVETFTYKNGMEQDRVTELCKFDHCPYHKDFVEMANEPENTITQTLHRMLNE